MNKEKKEQMISVPETSSGLIPLPLGNGFVVGQTKEITFDEFEAMSEKQDELQEDIYKKLDGHPVLKLMFSMSDEATVKYA